MRVMITGFGFVGKGMQKIFPNAAILDPALERTPNKRDVDLEVVCVPTPMKDSGECDVSIVEKVVHESQAKLILIKSTVAPGTTQRLRSETGKRIVFSPEYMSESKYWTPSEYLHPTDPREHGFVILGGDLSDCAEVIDILLPILGPTTRFRAMGSIEAELVKYTENSFFALKVTFANELRRICTLFGANYHSVREGWLDDPRTGPMHTAAFKQAPGFGGKCLPKDTAALAYACEKAGAPSYLLDAILAVNASHAK